MVPSVLAELSEMPRLPNGKINIKALLAIEMNATAIGRAVEESVSETEKELISIWEEVLKIKPVSVLDNFFEIGGDSILSIQVVAKAKKIGIELTPNQLFEHQTIAALINQLKPKAASPENKTTSLEKQLIEIWEEVLKMKPVGVHDNFFEIGGDSILSIQIVAKSKQLGIEITPNQLFEHQTIASLVNNVQFQESVEIKTNIYAGTVPLSPIQHWFFEEHKNAPHHWNDGIYFKVDHRSDQIKMAADYLIRRHEALRLAFDNKNGKWEANILAPDNINAYRRIDLAHLSKQDQDIAIREKIIELQPSLNLSRGSLFRFIYFDSGLIQKNCLCLFAHHLLFDNITWQILYDDLSTLLSRLNEGKTLFLPPIKNTYKERGNDLAQIVNSEKIKNDFDFWKKQASESLLLPVDINSELPALEESIEIVNIAFNNDFSHTELKNASTAFNLNLEELLLTALLMTLKNWSGIEEFRVGFENFGRKPFDDKKDYSELVGWITSFFPLILKINETDDLGNILKSIKEQYRSVPNNGLSYGVLRYLSENNSERELLNQKPAILFNYAGIKNQYTSEVLLEPKPFVVADKSRSPKSERYYLFEFNAFIFNDKLQVWWSYSKSLHKLETVNSLINDFENNLRSVIGFCMTTNTSGYTASDFTEVDISQEDLDQLIGQLE